MIAIDTSAFVAYLQGDGGGAAAAVAHVDAALASHLACLPPVVLTELLSEPTLPAAVRDLLLALPLLEVEPGVWQRAGELRAAVIARRQKARVADALIAQVCIDHGVPLVTLDRDFRHFTSAGLQLQ